MVRNAVICQWHKRPSVGIKGCLLISNLKKNTLDCFNKPFKPVILTQLQKNKKKFRDAKIKDTYGLVKASLLGKKTIIIQEFFRD